jgi:hypothetical protein
VVTSYGWKSKKTKKLKCTNTRKSSRKNLRRPLVGRLGLGDSGLSFWDIEGGGVDTSTTWTFVNVGTSNWGSSMQKRLVDRGKAI